MKYALVCCFLRRGVSPLAEGRELKYISEDAPKEAVTSPLAEGRELKFL